MCRYRCAHVDAGEGTGRGTGAVAGAGWVQVKVRACRCNLLETIEQQLLAPFFAKVGSSCWTGATDAYDALFTYAKFSSNVHFFMSVRPIINLNVI